MSSDRPCPQKILPPCPRKSTDEDTAVQEHKKEVEADAKTVKCIELWSPGFDARFPNQNQTRRCWVNYVDYIRCTNKFGEDHEPCEYFKKTFQYICPSFWISNWDEQRENGTFPMPPWA